MEKENYVFFSGSGNLDLGKKIIELCEYEQSNIIYTTFADGEYKPKLDKNVRAKTVFIIQPTNAIPGGPANNFFELLALVDAAKRSSAKEVIVIIPYFGNARQERKDEARTPITAKLCAKIIESAGADRVITMDLHADAIQGFFEIPVDNLYASYLFVPIIQSIKTSNTMFAAADTGGTKRATNYAKYFGTDVVICYKHREKPNEVEKVMVIGDPKDKDIIIIEDIIDTGGTIIKVSEALKEKGAKTIKVFASHGVLSGNVFQNIQNSTIEACYVTDSLQNASKYINGHTSFTKLKVISSAELFARAIQRNINGKSIKELFLL